MHTLYLLGFQGGSCGDFLCSKISELDNFHKVPYQHLPNSNTTDFSVLDIDPDFKIKSAYRVEHLNLSNDRIDYIKSILNSKNIILPTHYQNSITETNLPNLVPLSLNFTKLSKLFYTLLWIKKWSNPWQGFDPYNVLLSVDSIELHNRIQKMMGKQKIYSYERIMIHADYHSLDNFVIRQYLKYSSIGMIKRNDWRIIDADSLFTNPHTYIHEFNNILNISNSINPDVIENYHLENINLIERTFNKSIVNFFQSNWMNEIIQWVREKCPFN